jgi:hypothetical protein
VNLQTISAVSELGREIVKKHPIPPRRPVYTATKVSMAGFTVRGLENEISYVQQDWPLVALKELGDNPYDFFKEFYSDSPKEHRGITYNVWQPYPGNPDSVEYFIIRIAATSSNIDNRNVFEDLQLIFDLTKYCSSKRGQYKGGTGELGDALKRMLKMGYASWIGHSLNQGKPDLQWKEPMILTFNKKRYNVLLHVDTEIDEAKVIISQDHDAVIDSTDTVVSVALPACTSYDVQVDRLRQYYNIYRIPKIRTNFNFIEGMPPV